MNTNEGATVKVAASNVTTRETETASPAARVRCALLLGAALIGGHLASGRADAKSAGYLVTGHDMGARAQNVIVSRDGRPTGAASVFVNAAPLGLTSGGTPVFFGDLAASVPVGSALKLRVVVPEGEITAFDTVPERPTLIEPTRGALNVAAPITVRWSSATSPDRFVVAASWSCGPSCGDAKTFETSGGARSLVIPAHTLPSDTTLKVRVYAYNDGTETFSSPAAPGSRMAIRNGDEQGADFRTGTLAAGRPDLVVTAASIDVAASCRPYQPVLYVKAEVRNVGTAPNPVPSPEVGMVSALHASGNGWGNGAGVPALAPGESAVVRFPIYFLTSDPAFMRGAHRFDVAVNLGRWIEEVSTANNAFGAVTVTLPEGLCTNGK